MSDEAPIAERGEVDPPDLRADRPGVVTVFLSLAVGLGTGLALTALVNLLTSSLAFLFLMAEVGFLAGVVGYLAARGVDVPRVLRVGSVPRGVYWQALELGVALLAANAAAAVLLGPPTSEVRFVLEAETTLERIALAASVVVAAPLVEEALFRGLIQGVLERRLRHWFAIGSAATIFGALHGRDAGIFFVFWSLPLGWITWRSGSIRPAVAVHGLNNLIVLATLLATLEGRARVEPPPPTARTAVVAGAVLALMALWAVSACRRLAERLERSSRAARDETPPISDAY